MLRNPCKRADARRDVHPHLAYRERMTYHCQSDHHSCLEALRNDYAPGAMRADKCYRCRGITL